MPGSSTLSAVPKKWASLRSAWLTRPASLSDRAEGGTGKGRYQVEAEDLINRTDLDGALGHAEDDATGLVLSNGKRTFIVHTLEAVGSIATHPGQDHAEGGLGIDLCHRIEQHIGAGTQAKMR